MIENFLLNLTRRNKFYEDDLFHLNFAKDYSKQFDFKKFLFESINPEPFDYMKFLLYIENELNNRGMFSYYQFSEDISVRENLEQLYLVLDKNVRLLNYCYSLNISM